MIHRLPQILVGVAALLAAVGCGNRLEPDLQAQVNVLDGSINGFVQRTTRVKNSLSKARTNPDLKEAIDREKLMAPITAMEKEIEEARKARDKAVSELAKNQDSFAAEAKFDQAADALLEELEDQEAEVNRSARLVDVMRSPGQGGTQASAISEALSRLNPEAARARRASAAAARKHPHKAKDLEERVNSLTLAQEKAQEMLKVAEDEESKGYRDRFRYAEAFVTGEASAAQGLTVAADILARAEQLDQTILVTLEDMRADYLLTIGRSSWNQYSEYEREENQVFPPIAVSQHQFLEAARTSGNPRAQNDFLMRSGLLNQALPAGHTHSEAWIEDLDAKFYHLTTATSGGQPLSRGWEEVRPFVYFENVGNLGMDILSKPSGLYMDEALKIAAPHGMALVGDRRYGRWRRTSSGDVWVWLAAWSVIDRMTRNRSYSRGEWDAWTRNYRGRKPFYGVKARESDEDTYGSYGSATSWRFGATQWARSGAPGRTDPTVRGIGEWWRGGGPGGGGK